MHEAPRGDALRRFEREAKIAAGLQHPDMIGVFDLGEYEGRPFLVMELVASPTLAGAIQAAGAPPSVAAVVELGAAVAEVLAAAHEAGVVHRDLKPSNVFIEGPLDAPRRCRLADFGLAFMLEPGTEALGRLTGEGIMVGTPFYMAPEQAAGAVVGPPADVYSLGCMLHELVCGRPPFVGNLGRIVAGHLYLPPPALRGVEPDAPVELEQLVLAMLEKVPEARPTAREAAERLRGLRASQAAPGGRRPRSATLQGRLARAVAPPPTELPPDPGETPVVAVEVEDPTLGAALREASITLAADGPLALVAFEALGRPAGTGLARLALHPAPTAAVISTAIRLGAAGVARWPGPIEPLVQQIRKCWRRLPRP